LTLHQCPQTPISSAFISMHYFFRVVPRKNAGTAYDAFGQTKLISFEIEQLKTDRVREHTNCS